MSGENNPAEPLETLCDNGERVGCVCVCVCVWGVCLCVWGGKPCRERTTDGGHLKSATTAEFQNSNNGKRKEKNTKKERKTLNKRPFPLSVCVSLSRFKLCARMQALLAHAIDFSLLQSFPRLDIDAKFGACCL